MEEVPTYSFQMAQSKYSSTLEVGQILDDFFIQILDDFDTSREPNSKWPHF